MNQDAKRATGRGVPSERHAIGITRMCLRSGSVQLPFALSGSLPEGELLVHDAEADEPIVLWSEPPRRLAGLAPLFERHEVQVNDQLVLEVRGDDVRIAVAKRPRRSRPKVTPSTWTSHRDEPRPDGPRPDAPTQLDHHDDATRGTTERTGADEAGLEPRADAAANATGHAAGYRPEADLDARHEHPGGGDEAAGEELDEARIGRRTGPAQVRPPDDATAMPGGRAAWARPIDGVPVDEPDDDAPRAPRVTVRPTSDARSPSREGAEDSASATDDRSSERSSDRSSERGPARRSRGGPFAGLMRRARGWFGGDAGPRDEHRGPSDDAERASRDWLQAWDVDGDASDADPDAFDTEPALGRAVTPGPTAGRPRGEAPGAPPEQPPGTPTFVEEPAGRTVEETVEETLEETVEASFDETPHEMAGGAAEDHGVKDHGVKDHGVDARAARAVAPEPTTEPTTEPTSPAERRSSPADTPRDTTDATPLETTGETTDETKDETKDEPAAPAPRGSTSSTPLFFASTGQGGQAPGDASATPADPPPGPGATLPSGVPIRAERFLGGDLRTRLLRFLTSPEMPLIAKTDLIAKRFDLEPATAQEMLEDIADDPPDGLRLTVVREGAWRIERRSA